MKCEKCECEIEEGEERFCNDGEPFCERCAEELREEYLLNFKCEYCGQTLERDNVRSDSDGENFIRYRIIEESVWYDDCEVEWGSVNEVCFCTDCLKKVKGFLEGLKR